MPLITDIQKMSNNDGWRCSINPNHTYNFKARFTGQKDDERINLSVNWVGQSAGMEFNPFALERDKVRPTAGAMEICAWGELEWRDVKLSPIGSPTDGDTFTFSFAADRLNAQVTITAQD